MCPGLTNGFYVLDSGLWGIRINGGTVILRVPITSRSSIVSRCHFRHWEKNKKKERKMQQVGMQGRIYAEVDAGGTFERVIYVKT